MKIKLTGQAQDLVGKTDLVVITERVDEVSAYSKLILCMVPKSLIIPSTYSIR
jgi:hypothetical protein